MLIVNGRNDLKSHGNLVMLNHKLRTFKSQKSFKGAIDYFNDTKKADMSLLEKSMDANECKEGHYFLREGTTGAFDSFGDKASKQMMDEFKCYNPNKIWTNFISIRREDAKELGLLGKREYAQYTEKIVMYMAKELGITPSNLVWSGFYHVDTPSHDNVHFYLFDKANPNSEKLLTKNQIYKLKSMAISDVLDRAPMLKRKDTTKYSLQSKVKEIIENENISNGVNWKSSLPKAYQNKFIELVNVLPKNGRLSYNSYNLKEHKILIDECIDLLVNSGENKALYINFRNALDDVIDVNKDIYGNVEGKAHENYRNEQLRRLYAVIGNCILKEVKSYRENRVHVIKDMTSDKKKEANYVNRRLKKKCTLNNLLTSKSNLLYGLRRINTYYASRTRQDLMNAAREVAKTQEEEKEYE